MAPIIAPGTVTTQCRRVSLINGGRKIGFTCNRFEIEPFSYNIYKNQLKGKDSTLRPKAMKLLKLRKIGLGSNFLGLTVKAQIVAANIDKWDYIKLESFCTTKATAQ